MATALVTPKIIRTQFAAIAYATIVLAGGDASAQSQHVAFEYNFAQGDELLNTVYLEPFDDRPITTANFLAYVNGGRYTDVLMHRTVQGFVVQGGGFLDVRQDEPAPLDWSVDTSATVDLDGDPLTANPTILNEFDGTRSNTRGTLGMAKLSGDPDSASSQWFYNLADNGPNLDFQNGGFTTFAEVVGGGMTLVDSIAAHRVSNFNPDLNDDGVIDGGAMTDTPFFVNNNGEIDLFRIVEAKQIDYFGAGSSTFVPSPDLTFSERDVFIDSDAEFTGFGRLVGGPGIEWGIAGNVELSQGIQNRGVLKPGEQLGWFSTANFTQFAEGTLSIQLGGTLDGVEYDKVVSNGLTQLGGTLEVDLVNGFTPSAGDEFVILEGDAVVFDFAYVELPELRESLVWKLEVNSTQVLLSALGGDYNNDGQITTADFEVWQGCFGLTGSHLADGNFDGVVDAADYTIWRDSFSQFGTTVASATAAPEPAAATLLIFAGLLGCRRRR